MFFCDKCAEKRDWPESFSKSYGKCEICDNVTVCSDVPSRYLPIPKIPDHLDKEERQQNGIISSRIAVTGYKECSH